MMFNLLDETRKKLEEHGLSFDDVVWIGTPDSEIPINAFMQLADREYDNGYGLAKVAMDLVICGTDWWLEQYEYDGAECWVYKTQPKRPERIVTPKRIIVSDELITGDATLEEMSTQSTREDICEAEEPVPLAAIYQRKIPKYLPKEGFWAVETADGVETGELEYVCGEFANDGLIYHFHHAEGADHEHTFAGVLQAVLDEPDRFSIQGFENEYSQQERQFLHRLQHKLKNTYSI